MQSALASSALEPAARAMAGGNLRLPASDEESLLHVDLSGLDLPKVNNLQVDGLQRTWWSRLFGR